MYNTSLIYINIYGRGGGGGGALAVCLLLHSIGFMLFIAKALVSCYS